MLVETFTLLKELVVTKSELLNWMGKRIGNGKLDPIHMDQPDVRAEKQ